jgi:hypothetical protein
MTPSSKFKKTKLINKNAIKPKIGDPPGNLFQNALTSPGILAIFWSTPFPGLSTRVHLCCHRLPVSKDHCCSYIFDIPYNFSRNFFLGFFLGQNYFHLFYVWTASYLLWDFGFEMSLKQCYPDCQFLLIQKYF